MAHKVLDIVRLLKPLRSEQKSFLRVLSQYVDVRKSKQIQRLVKQKKIILSREVFDPYPGGMSPVQYVLLQTKDHDLSSFVEDVNHEVKRELDEKAFKQFSGYAATLLPQLIAPHILGMDLIKKTVALQLFATEPFHILLLGDPGTGKTDIMRSVENLHSITSFGLGSGATGVGLGATVKGKIVEKGLLPLADKGICCIDELNLLKEVDRGALYNAMEKGFITYDKGGEHLRISSEIRLLATANPKGLRFVGTSAKSIRAQVPLDHALMSRFHAVFLLRKPDTKRLAKIAHHLMQQQKPPSIDYTFIKDYVDYAGTITVDFPETLQKQVVNFITKLKEHEERYIADITPRDVIAVIRLAKAAARLELRTKVKEKDIELAEQILKEGLLEKP